MSRSNCCSGISSFSVSLMFQSHKSGSWAFGGEECGDDCLEELFGLVWVDLLEDSGVDFGVSGTIFGLSSWFPVKVVGWILWCAWCWQWCCWWRWWWWLGWYLFMMCFWLPFWLLGNFGAAHWGWGRGVIGGWRSFTFVIVDWHRRKGIITVNCVYWVCPCWDNSKDQDLNSSQ